MSQLKLITESEWTPTELLMTLHAKVDRIQQDQEHMFRMLATVLAAVKDDPETLHKLVRGLSVVPFEDEAEPVVEPLPVLAHCHTCDKNAYTEEEVEERFGYRTPAGRKTIVQSWCRECRSSGKDKASSTGRNKMPAHIKQLSTEATRLANEGNDMIRKAHEMIAASTGHVSKEAQRLLNEGSQRLAESAKLKSEYGKAQKAAKKASRSK